MYAFSKFSALLALALAATSAGALEIRGYQDAQCGRLVVAHYREPGSISECINLGSGKNSASWDNLNPTGGEFLYTGVGCTGDSYILRGGSGCLAPPSGSTWRSVRVSVSNPNP
ncbi:hypothetical protein MIND_00118700 [Mycena indigotica]|uniref:Uncharacterized protein n=1 Tax=Mycena indigotica TaxID=2126181 RepID=A0A8H6TFX3_9AGAR|nr:uncharacterized protein MIND_00118700 [Mycena indigotica]KAF7316012.1 hypothetical protein MIND_00118700 [Mycena indigotica]